MTELASPVETKELATVSDNENVLSSIETVVIYHGGCPDGVSAAWVVSLVLDNNKTYYHGAVHGQPPLKTNDKTLIFVDFAYKLDVILRILQQSKKVIVLDHHKTSEELTFITDPRFELKLDMKSSGAQLAWNYACMREFPEQHQYAKYGSPAIKQPDKYVKSLIVNAIKSKTCPWFINDIADRDLWKWEIEDSKNTTRAMFSLNIYENINSFYNLLSIDRAQLIQHGKILNDEDDNKCKNIIKTAKYYKLRNPNSNQSWRVAVVMCDSLYKSEVGNRLASESNCDFAMMCRYDLEKDEWHISCRASQSSDIDLTKVVPLFDPDGGGHPKAAGMTLIGAEELRRLLPYTARINT